MKARTLVEILTLRASRNAAGGYTFLPRGEEEGGSLSWAELDRRARAVAAHLRERAAPGERALLAFPPGLEFIVGLFGCFYAGVVAVPALLPGKRQGRERFASLAADSGATLALTEAGALDRLRELAAPAPGAPALPCLATDALDPSAAEAWREPAIAPDSLALLQYTSGSTAEPRGVMVSHANLLYNEAAIRAAFRQDEESVVVGWLPVHHDMGLVGNVLQPLVSGSRAVLMPPVVFLQRPARWLAAITRYRGTTSGGPDFAYDLCVRRIPKEEREGLDLASWRVAFDGAEPVRHDTLERFAAAFGPCGFRREAFQPCYGLAEATLLVAAADPGGAAAWGRAEALAAGRFVPGPPEDPSCRALESCGRPAEGQRVRVVDPDRREALPEGRVGEIWVAGPSVAAGYWNRPEETAETFRAALAGEAAGRWLRTGDLGFLAGGALHVTGRRKDLIIVRGRNLYPQDLERTAAGSHPLLRSGGGAAFALDTGGEEQVAVVHELERAGIRGDTDEIVRALRERVAEEHGVHVAVVALLPPGRLPRTTSGKVRRRACAEALRLGTLETVAESRVGRATGGARPSLSAADLAALPEEDREPALGRYLHDLLGHLLDRGSAEIAADRPLSAFGLDSLAAMELRGAIEADLGRELPVADLLGGLTLAELARRLASGAAEVAPGPPPGPRRARLLPGETEPLSHGQRSLWFLHRLQPESAAYNVAFAAWLDGGDTGLDVDALRGALADLVARHDVLASVIEAPAGEPVRRLVPRPEPHFEIVDARTWPEHRLREAAEAAARRPFDLAREPPLRAHLYRRAGGAYLAVLAVHHVAVDFWSLVVMAEELGALYSARREGHSAALPPPAAGYGDFVRWQEGLLAGKTGERLWRRWRERLGGELPRLELPADRPRPPVQGSRGVTVPFALAAETRRRLEALAAERGATLYGVLLACFAALLRRYCGQDDLLVGTPMAGRSREDFAQVVGYVSNLVPLRIDASGDPPFAELVERTAGVVGEALELQDFPFPLLVERLQPERDPARHPLVQAVFALERPHRLRREGIAGFVLGEEGAEIELGGLRLRSAPLAAGGAPFDLTVVMVEADGGLRGSWRSNADLFSEETARRMAEHFVTLAEAVARRPEARLSALSPLAEAERRRVVVEWNDTAAPYPAERAIHELFAEQARERPDAVAVAAGGERLSYAELARRAGRLARHLRAAGVGPECRVGVALARGAAVPVALLGVLEAGGAYVPLDPGYPPERLRLMLADAGVRAVIGDPALAASLGPGVELVAIEEALAAEPAAAGPPPAVPPEALAYVMYTSGSTGVPKGVMVPHRAVVRLVRGAGYASFGPEEVVLHASPLAFDASTFEVWGALLHGGRLVVHDGSPSSLVELGAAVAEHGITTLWLTAGLFHLMVEERVGDLRPLRQLLAGGDVLSPTHVARALAELPGVRLIDGYGPTEGTTFSCCHPIARAPGPGERVPIGGPIANTRAYVLDEAGEPAPVGVPGELAIGGDGLARGYLGDPALTARRFVPDPFALSPGGRLYRTGDRARWRPDGSLDFLGRWDDQVKVRGFRVEPGEVEAALTGHPEVGAAAVVARADGAGQRLVAYVTGRDGRRPPPPGELAAHLADRLPPYLVPSVFVPLERLPLNRNGKVDRRALPPPPPPGAAAGAPAEGLTGEIAAVWAEVLGVPAVDLDRNLFELGAHSLAVAKAQARLVQRLGREIAVVDLFAHPTIRALAAHLGGGTADGAREEGYRRAAARRAARARRRDAAAAAAGPGPTPGGAGGDAS